MLKLNILTPKGTPLRDSAHFEPSYVKISAVSIVTVYQQADHVTTTGPSASSRGREAFV